MAENNVDLRKPPYTQTEKVVQGAIPSYAIRHEKPFFPWKTNKKRLSTVRFARLIVSDMNKIFSVCRHPPSLAQARSSTNNVLEHHAPWLSNLPSPDPAACAASCDPLFDAKSATRQPASLPVADTVTSTFLRMVHAGIAFFLGHGACSNRFFLMFMMHGFPLKSRGKPLSS